jgi:alkylhydroperoxidase/carboxymuconolactone decarboxylase family protein YurZ
MMSDKEKELDAELANFRDSYVEMFGSLPPLPSGRFALSGEIDPEFLRDAERLRARAFYNKAFDMKTTQLILFGMLLVEHNQIAAQAHADAARRAGASWEELHTVVELASATGALYPFNQGSAVLNAMREKEKGK